MLTTTPLCWPNVLYLEVKVIKNNINDILHYLLGEVIVGQLSDMSVLLSGFRVLASK